MSRGDIEISPTVQFVRVEGDFVLMDLAAGVYFGLDPVATRIWQSLADHGDPAEAADELTRDYDVEPARARADIDTWIAELEAKGLVHRRAAPSVAPAAPVEPATPPRRGRGHRPPAARRST